MKRLSTLLLAVAIAALTAVNAQMPRIRTSAPAEKTAQKGAPAPKVKASDKAEGKKAAKAGAAKANRNNGGKKGSKKAVETVTPSSDIYMALKTNVAYDALAVINLAYECQFAKKWTAELPVMWSLWDWKESRGVRTVAIQPGVKYWFSSPGNGNAVGVDFDLAWYNARWDDSRYQTAGRPAMGASVVYAYSLNMGRGWKAEFSLGVGYINTRYNTYYNISNGALIDTRTKNYFGPTRVGISLVYSL
ncbi:MAG: DUF3575 domain-containing protein [Muribaculaceae bacterium]|nr:DUF3575 domain-containing protein [Muribaculaceae bacterium]